MIRKAVEMGGSMIVLVESHYAALVEGCAGVFVSWMSTYSPHSKKGIQFHMLLRTDVKDTQMFRESDVYLNLRWDPW